MAQRLMAAPPPDHFGMLVGGIAVEDGVTGDKWALELSGCNPSNELTTYRGVTPPAVITTGSRIRFVSDPRAYGVTLRASF